MFENLDLTRSHKAAKYYSQKLFFALTPKACTFVFAVIPCIPFIPVHIAFNIWLAESDQAAKNKIISMIKGI
jgi:hypothetical protein